jgi:NADPH:quinone reductase-like Zn-dependent oxidoreductase
MDAYMLLKLMPDYSRLQPPRYVTQDNTFFISSMLLLPDENVSFGDQIFTNGGRPEGSRPLVGNRNRSQVAACYVMPRKKHGGIEFVLTLFEDEWPFLLESEEFGRYAPSGFVEVEAFAFGMNFRDVLVALGQLDETFLAHELGGVIKRMGPDTEESGLQVRDRVCGASTGRYSSTSQGHWTSYVKIPDDMSYEWAATIPVGYSTAYHSLFHIARLQKGESVLVHAAAGGFGQAAVILAQWKGAEVFATCSSEAKRDLLAEQYNIPLDHILSSRDASFAPAIMALTNGKGVDVVVNSLAGALLKATWDCIARFGRFIEVGKIDMEASRRLDLTPFRRCATFASVDLMQLREYNRPLSHEALVESVKICHERGEPPALPITEFSISDVEKAMRLMQAGKHMGKLVLVPGAEDLVKVSLINPTPFFSLSQNAHILYRSSQPCGQCP